MREDTRKCKRCKKSKKITEYSLTGATGAGRQYPRWVCKKCRREIYHLNKKGKDTRAYTAKVYKCIYDPEELFLGTSFFKGTFRGTLADGNWPPGSWWLDMQTGSRYQVRGNYLVHLLGEGKSKPQRLVRSYGDRQPPGG